MATSQGFVLLLAEIDRIVNSPYPTQLKQLHTISCHQCSDLDILHWAAARPCQIDALAQNLLEAWQQWSYVLEIIAKLCNATSIRDSLLRHHPTLLFEVVSQAVTGSWQHNAAAIAMLSHALPENITLPAASQILFLGIVDHAVQSPSTSSIRPVYLLLKGGLAPLMGLLSNEILTQLESHFLNTLRSTIGQEDQCLSLYCLAIMKAMVTVANEDLSFSSSSMYQTQELLASTPNSPRWKPKGMQQYFTGSKAHKTLHLIALRVIWASRVTGEDAIKETSQVLTLSTDIIKNLSEDIREGWCSENPILVRKLQDRASQSDLDTHVQLQAFAFISNLCKPRRIPEAMTSRLAQILSHPSNLTRELIEGIEPSIEGFASVLNSTQFSDLFASLTAFAVNGEDSELARCGNAVSQIVNALSLSLGRYESVAIGALTALSFSGVADSLTSLRRLLQTESGSTDERRIVICKQSLLQARKGITQALCGLYLKAALIADHTQTDVALDLYPLLIEVHALSASRSTPCSHVVVPSAHQSYGAAEVVKRVADGTGWRQNLNQHLQSKLKSEHGQLLNFFSHACADLEERCADVEAPLREERNRLVELQEQYLELSRAYTDLEDEKSRIKIQTDAADTEMAALSRELDISREENDNLLSRIDELELRLLQSQTEAEQRLAAMKRSVEITEMGNATTIAKQEEHLDELEIKLSSVQIDLQTRDDRLCELQQELDAARKKSSSLEVEIRAYRDATEDHANVMVNVNRGKEELAERCASLLTELKTLQSQLAAEAETHHANLMLAQQQAQVEVNLIRDENNRRLEELRERHRTDLNCMSEELMTAQNETRLAQEEHASQLAKREKKLSDCIKKLEHLKGVCAEKEDQIAEATAMRMNLMAAMGLGNMRTQGSQPANRRTTRSSAAKREALDGTDFSLPLVDVAGATRLSAIPLGFDLTAHDSQGDPSPKRAKPRKSAQAVSPVRARASTASRATRNSHQERSTTKRQPLLVISGNATPSRARANTPCTGVNKVSEFAFDDTTFDGSEVFCSTPGLNARINQVLPDDESTMRI